MKPREEYTNMQREAVVMCFATILAEQGADKQNQEAFKRFVLICLDLARALQDVKNLQRALDGATQGATTGGAAPGIMQQSLEDPFYAATQGATTSEEAPGIMQQSSKDPFYAATQGATTSEEAPGIMQQSSKDPRYVAERTLTETQALYNKFCTENPDVLEKCKQLRELGCAAEKLLGTKFDADTERIVAIINRPAA